MRGTINYRWDSTGARTAYVQLTGNPVAWFLGLLALLASAALIVLWSWQALRGAGAARRPGARHRPDWAHRQGGAERPARAAPADPARRALIVMLLAQWFVYMGVHAYIGMERVMYLYHYFIALMMAYCLVPLVFAEAAERWPVLRERQVSILAGMAVLVWVGFIFYAPLTFHWYLTFPQCEWRNVLQHVITCHR